MSLARPHDDASGTPLISVVMANFCGAAFLAAALESILSQTIVDLEIIVSDDASPDDSVSVVRRFAARDPRIRLVVAESNAGPAAARNRALASARGEWIAIVDSDDIIHPERFEILLAAAHRHNADAIADDLLFFSSDGGRGGTLLGRTAGGDIQPISAAHFIHSNTAGSGLPPLGYLKPMIKRSALVGLFYDEAVRIGEDYDFLLRFLLAGGRLFILPELLYLYRRHSRSISHRLSEETVQAMIANQQALTASRPDLSPEIARLSARRIRALQFGLSFERLVLALKRKQPADIARLLAANPRLVLPLARSVSENLQARLKRNHRPKAKAKTIALYDQDRPPPDAPLLHSALGLEREVEPVPVPPYEPCAERQPAGENVRAWRVRMAQMDVQLVCHGLAGMYAAGFLPQKRVAGVVIHEAQELAPVLGCVGASPARLLVSDAALQAASPALDGETFCPGFRLVRGPARDMGEDKKATKAASLRA